MMFQATHQLITKSRLLVMVSRTESNSGESKTLGVHIGVRTVSSGSLGESITLAWSQAAIGPPQSKIGLICTPLLRQRRTILPMTRLSMSCHSQSTRVMRSLLLKVLVVPKLLNSLTVLKRLFHTLGLQLQIFPNKLTGEIWMDVTICHGAKISIFPNTAAHAGLKELPVPLPTDSTSWTTSKTQPPSA